MRRAVAAVLLTFLFLVALFEVYLHSDPFGVYRYSDDMALLFGRFVYTPGRVITYRPGVVTFSNWQMTTLGDGNRAVPGTNTAAMCKIVLLGDSVTFAWGVSDAETWPNLVALQLPNVHLVNTGSPGYSIYEVAATMDAVPADGYVYLLVNNDNVRPRYRGATPIPTPLRSTIQTHLEFPLYMQGAEAEFDAAFYATLERLIAAGVSVAAFDVGKSKALAVRYPAVRLIPFYTSRISRADAHADAAGNRQLAASIFPIVKELAAQVCSEIV
jgi:hypothetical protein